MKILLAPFVLGATLFLGGDAAALTDGWVTKTVHKPHVTKKVIKHVDHYGHVTKKIIKKKKIVKTIHKPVYAPVYAPPQRIYRPVRRVVYRRPYGTCPTSGGYGYGVSIGWNY